MFYRLAGIRHTSYSADRALWPVPVDRVQIAVLLLLALLAPFVLPNLISAAISCPGSSGARRRLGSIC